MDGVPDEIIERQLAHFHLVKPEYGDGIRAARAALAEAGRCDLGSGKLVAAE